LADNDNEESQDAATHTASPAASVAGSSSSVTGVRKPESAPATAEAGDSATVSAGASQLAGTSDVRMEKVAGVQQALAAGSYHVSSGDLADSLIASMMRKS